MRGLGECRGKRVRKGDRGEGVKRDWRREAVRKRGEGRRGYEAARGENGLGRNERGEGEEG